MRTYFLCTAAARETAAGVLRNQRAKVYLP